MTSRTLNNFDVANVECVWCSWFVTENKLLGKGRRVYCRKGYFLYEFFPEESVSDEPDSVYADIMVEDGCPDFTKYNGGDY